MGTGRSICPAQGVAEFSHCGCLLFEPRHHVADDGGDYACCNFCFFGFISIPYSKDRESILLEPQLQSCYNQCIFKTDKTSFIYIRPMGTLSPTSRYPINYYNLKSKIEFWTLIIIILKKIKIEFRRNCFLN